MMKTLWYTASYAHRVSPVNHQQSTMEKPFISQRKKKACRSTITLLKEMMDAMWTSSRV